MDSLELDGWRDALEKILLEYAALPTSYGEIRAQVLFDRVRDGYLLQDIGWKGYERIHEVLIHVEVIEGKLWVQYDGTEDGIATRLVAAGVPRDRIVLGFKPPNVRKYTDFAAA